MQKISDFLTLLDSYLGSSSWFVFFLLGTGLFFTIYLKFPQFRYFRHALRVTLGRYDKKGDHGDTTHFGALATALSGTIGTGNIAGVALAIHLGGPAALFWMIVTALLGMCTKFVEVTLSLKYREKAADGTMSGGPMYYMRDGLKWKWLAAVFAVCTIFSAFGTGNLPQINAIANSFEATFGFNKMLVGAVLAILMGLIIMGGIKRIAKVTTTLVPFMAILYVLGGVSVLIAHYDNILPSIASVFTDVFNGTAATGGFLGAGFAWAFNRGVNRGLFSNEAGQGSSPIAHSAAKTDEPVSEGVVAILEPFIDTVLVCFMTGVILLSSGAWQDKSEGRFQPADTYVMEAGSTTENVLEFYNNAEPSNLFTGVVSVVDGVIHSGEMVLHSRSVAEDVVVSKDGQPYTGEMVVAKGKIENKDVALSGKSLLHSAPLTTEAFGRGLFGSLGSYIIPISLLLFAFSSAISWGYYGDRAVVYLFGTKWLLVYRLIFVVAFFFGAFVDTTIIWVFSGVTVALMTIPNLIGILALRKTMKGELREYWARFRKENPDVKSPENR